MNSRGCNPRCKRGNRYRPRRGRITHDNGLVRPLRGRNPFIVSIRGLPPTAIHIFPLRGIKHAAKLLNPTVMESRNPKLQRSDIEMNMSPRWGFSSSGAGGYNHVAPTELRHGSSVAARTPALIQRQHTLNVSPRSTLPAADAGYSRKEVRVRFVQKLHFSSFCISVFNKGLQKHFLRRGNRLWPRWKKSWISECRAAHETFSLSSGERAGVRASVLPSEFFRLCQGGDLLPADKGAIE